MSKQIDDSIIKEGEHHPAADEAMVWFRFWEQDILRYSMIREAIASTALSGDRLAQIANGTLERLATGKPVSDRYLLGLCWMLKSITDAREGAEKLDKEIRAKRRKKKS